MQHLIAAGIVAVLLTSAGAAQEPTTAQIRNAYAICKDHQRLIGEGPISSRRLQWDDGFDGPSGVDCPALRKALDDDATARRDQDAIAAAKAMAARLKQKP